MKLITVGLGILIDNVFMLHLYKSISSNFLTPVVKTCEFGKFNGELTISLSILLAYWLVKKFKVFQRLPAKPPGEISLTIGVYLFAINWAIYLLTRISFNSMLLIIDIVPLRILFLDNSYLLNSCANLLIGYGIFQLLLSAKNEDS